MRASLTHRSEAGVRLAAWVWRLDPPRWVASSASVGGGVGRRDWVVNAQVPRDYARRDLAAHGREIAAALGLSGSGVVMLTAAPVARARAARSGGVVARVSAGVDPPTWAAGPDAPTDTGPGTINTVVVVPARLSPGALLNLLTTATEAKAQALGEAGIAGTGTPSDALTVVTRLEGPIAPFGGPRSPWGARVARAVHGALAAALAAAP